MMMALLVMKTRCKEIYEKHYKVLRAILKILASAGIFTTVLYQLPFDAGLHDYAVPLVIALSLFCGFIPDMAVMCLVLVLTMAEVASVSVAAAFGYFLILAVYFLLFGRYTGTQSYIVLLIPVLWGLNLSYAVPVIAALFLTPAMIPACIVGIFIRYLLAGIKEYFMVSESAVETGNTFEGLQYIFDYVFKNKEMLIVMLTFSAVYLLVYAVRKGKYNHASHIAIFVGIVTCMAGLISGDILWSVSVDTNKLLLGLILTALVAYVVQFFHMSLDYTGTRNLQFEDDEYFYYVKAVPKLKVAVVDKTVTRIEEDTDSAVIDLRDEIEKVLEEDIHPENKG